MQVSDMHTHANNEGALPIQGKQMLYHNDINMPCSSEERGTRIEESQNRQPASQPVKRNAKHVIEITL